MGRAGNRKWTSEADIKEKLTRMGIDQEEMFSKKLLTPAQMCKVVTKKDLSLKQIETYWNSPEGKPTIAHETDKRDEIQPISTECFSDIEN